MCCMLAHHLNTQDKHTSNHPDIPQTAGEQVTCVCHSLQLQTEQQDGAGQKENHGKIKQGKNKSYMVSGLHVTRGKLKLEKEHLSGRRGRRMTDNAWTCTPSNDLRIQERRTWYLR